MKHHFTVVLALACCTAVAAIGQAAIGQGPPRNVGQNGRMAPSQQGRIEELPRGESSPGQPIIEGYHDGVVGEGFGPSGVYHGGYDGGGYFPDECCDQHGGYGCGGECYSEGGPGCGVLSCYSSTGQWFVAADYLYLRAHFSEAVAFVEREIQGTPQVTTDQFRQLDFDYDSSYRFGGGYRNASCGHEFRFMFTQMTSFADDVAPDGSFLPFDPDELDGEEATIHSFVDVDAYDFECRKTIPLGGRLGSGCGDAGCGDACYGEACGTACPAWDITWSGGVRLADVDWNRSYLVDDGGTEATRDISSILNFEGGGPRIGLEGRRYWGQGGWFSVFMKGDISLLLGHLDLVTRRRTSAGDPNDQSDDIFAVQPVRNRQIIPVTEIETGLSAHLTRNSVFSAGYLFSAWHDLGFRDEFRFASPLESNYDDANILSFDGFFARMELGY